jgi:tetratricopeptide (TPR) repeat protein
MMRTAASWAIVLMLGTSFAVLAYTTGEGTGSKAVPLLVSIFGFALVFLLWFGYRHFSLHATLSRAVAIGDFAEVEKLTRVGQAKPIGFPRSTPMSLYYAQALEQRGQFSQVLQILEAASDSLTRSSASWLAASVKVGALASVGNTVASRQVFDRELAVISAVPRTMQHATIQLARGRLLLAEKQLAEVIQLANPLTSEIQLGPLQRAVAFAIVAKALAQRGDHDSAMRAHQQAASLAPETWMASR